MLLIYLDTRSSVAVLYGHCRTADLLVEEWLKDDNLIAGFNKGHEGAEHAYALSVSTLT